MDGARGARPVYAVCSGDHPPPSFSIDGNTLVPALLNADGTLLHLATMEPVRARVLRHEPRATSDAYIMELFGMGSPAADRPCADFRRCLQTETLLFLDRDAALRGAPSSLLDFMLTKRAILVGKGRLAHVNERGWTVVGPQAALAHKELHARVSIGEFCSLFPDLYGTPEMAGLMRLAGTLRKRGQGRLEYELDYYVLDGGNDFSFGSRNAELQKVLAELGYDRYGEAETTILAAGSRLPDRDGLVLLQNVGPLDFDPVGGAMLVKPTHIDRALYAGVRAMLARYVWLLPLDDVSRPAFVVGRYCFYEQGAEPAESPAA